MDISSNELVLIVAGATLFVHSFGFMYVRHVNRCIEQVYRGKRYASSVIDGGYFFFIAFFNSIGISLVMGGFDAWPILALPVFCLGIWLMLYAMAVMVVRYENAPDTFPLRGFVADMIIFAAGGGVLLLAGQI